VSRRIERAARQGARIIRFPSSRGRLSFFLFFFNYREGVCILHTGPHVSDVFDLTSRLIVETDCGLSGKRIFNGIVLSTPITDFFSLPLALRPSLRD
jgi:hypothetical protein